MAKKGDKKTPPRRGQGSPALPAITYVHSGCCGVHWELEYLGSGRYRLTCEVCGKPAGGFTIEGPRLEGRGCQDCGQDRKSDA